MGKGQHCAMQLIYEEKEGGICYGSLNAMGLLNVLQQQHP